jgi:F-type H+-transporting ATPase subunit c
MPNRLVEFGFIISRGDKRSVELAIPQDMQCKPGVAFIPKPMTKSDRHPLNHGGESLAGKFSYQFYALSRRRAANQSTNPIHSKEKTMKRNLIRLGFGLTALLFTAMPALAQPAAAPAEGGSGLGRGLGLLGAIIGMGIAAGLCGIGQGRVASAACEGMARNPNAANRVQLALILGLAFIETLVIFTLVVVLIYAPSFPAL